MTNESEDGLFPESVASAVRAEDKQKFPAFEAERTTQDDKKSYR